MKHTHTHTHIVSDYLYGKQSFHCYQKCTAISVLTQPWDTSTSAAMVSTHLLGMRSLNSYCNNRKSRGLGKLPKELGAAARVLVFYQSQPENGWSGHKGCAPRSRLMLLLWRRVTNEKGENPTSQLSSVCSLALVMPVLCVLWASKSPELRSK